VLSFALGQESAMITGFNTDVEYNGQIYHVQTEDKGSTNPVIESLIYLGGEILAAHRTPYSRETGVGADAKALAERLESQHRRMILNVRQGRYDPDGVKPFGAGIVSDRDFDQVVLDYLEAELGTEPLQVVLDSSPEFPEGREVEIVLRARGEQTSLPVPGTRISVFLLTPLDKPVTLAEGKSGLRGEFRTTVRLPRMEEGDAAVLVHATLGDEMVELKWPLSRNGSRR
jgi:hypothetical protein